MVSSSATSVDEYIADIKPERRADVVQIRELILENLAEGYVETMRWGIITHEVPLDLYPHSYDGQPLKSPATRRAAG